jgi:hypothetical protein
VVVQGEVDAQSISQAIKTIQSTLQNGVVRVAGRRAGLRGDAPVASTLPLLPDGTVMKPQFALQQWYIKSCFNNKGEPAMAVYEMQYGLSSTTLFLEVELEGEL